MRKPHLLANSRSFEKTPWVALFFLGCLGISASQADDWPQWLGPKRDGVWRENGILEKFPAAGPKVRWRTSVAAGYSGPAVARGKVFITDRILDPGSQNPVNAFQRADVTGKERVLCLDEGTGKILWQHNHPCNYKISYPAGPRTTPVVAKGKVYTLGAMGDLFCLDGKDGTVLWSKNFPKDYSAPVPLWGFSAHPLLDGDKLICLVGGEGSLVVAFHKDTGKELWRSLTAQESGYCPPMIYEAGGTRQLIIWHPEAVCSLDPDTGKEYWRWKFELRAGLSVPTPRKYGNLLFVTALYNGPLMLQLDPNKPAASLLWKGKSNSEQPRLTDGLHSIMVTPVLKGEHIYGVCSYGELRCLKMKTGERVWATHQATGGKSTRWGNAFLVEHQERFFLFNEQGDLILAKLNPQGYEEISRTNILEPTNHMAGRPVVWSHPAFANQSVYARNDKEIVCISLAAE